MIAEMRFLTLLALVLSGPVAFAQTSNTATAPSTATAAAPSVTDANQGVDPAKAAEIRKLLELSGTSKLMKQAIESVIGKFRLKYNTLSDDFWARTEKEIDTNDLINKLVPIYDKYYSLDDLKAVNAFYSTPAGQRMLTSAPQITRESIGAIQEWAKGTAFQITLDAEKEKIKMGMQAAAAASAPAINPTSTPSTNAAPSTTSPSK